MESQNKTLLVVGKYSVDVPVLVVIHCTTKRCMSIAIVWDIVGMKKSYSFTQYWKFPVAGMYVLEAFES